MALCLFKCLASCGCRDCMIRKLAFYPPVPGYRFEEIEVSISSTKRIDQEGEKYSPTKKKHIKENISNFLNQTNQTINLPKFAQLQSHENKHYNLILVYEEDEVLINDEEQFNIHEKQIKNEQSDNKIQYSISGITQSVDEKKQSGIYEETLGKDQEKVQLQKQSLKQEQQSEKDDKKQQEKVDKKNQSKKGKNAKIDKKEERFKQVEDLNLICFKKKTRENSIICGYHIENLRHKSEIVVIYSHGNSTDIGYMINQALDVSYNLRVNVIAYDYSGYGHSSGKPSEKSLIYDLEAIYLYAKELGYYPINIILYGQSIGSGPSTFLASQKRFPIGGIIIHSGFTSGLRITQSQQKSMKKTYKKDFFPNVEFIRKINAPVLIVHGTNDEDIKNHHASELYNKAKKNYQPFIFNVQGAGHNNIEHDEKYRKQYFSELREFFNFLRKNRRQLQQNQNQIHKFEKTHSSFSSQNLYNNFGQSHQQEYNFPQNNVIADEKDYTSGFPGDGWSESFNHIYKQFFTPSDSLMVNKEQINSNDKQQSNKSYEQENNQYIPPNYDQQIYKQQSNDNKQSHDNIQYHTYERNPSNRNKQSMSQNNPEEYKNVKQNKGDHQTENIDEQNEIKSKLQKREGDIISDQCNLSENLFKKNSQQNSSPKINEIPYEIFARESEDDNQQLEVYVEDNSVKESVNTQKDQYLNENQQDQDYKGIYKSKNQSMSKNQSESNQSNNINLNKFNQSKSLKNTPTHQYNTQTDKNNRMSFPNLNERMNGLRNSVIGNNKKSDYTEEDNIRLHNVTSITRKKQNSMFSAYIVDNNSQTNQDKNSQSQNSSMIFTNDRLIQNNNHNQPSSSFHFDEKQQNNIVLTNKNKSYSQSFGPSSIGISNNNQRVNNNQKNQDQKQSKNDQKFDPYRVDSIVQEEIQEYYQLSSNLTEQQISKLHNSASQQQQSLSNSNINQSTIKQKQNVDPIQQKQTENKNDQNNKKQIVKSVEENPYTMSESDSSIQSQSPHHSGSIMQVNVHQQSVSDSDSFALNIKNKSQNNISIKSKETLKSINSNY